MGDRERFTAVQPDKEAAAGGNRALEEVGGWWDLPPASRGVQRAQPGAHLLLRAPAPDELGTENVRRKAAEPKATTAAALSQPP